MAVTRVPAVFRPDGGGGYGPRKARKCVARAKSRTGKRSRIGDGALPTGTATRCRNTGTKVALLGAVGVLVVQFVGALAVSSKGGDIKVEVKVPAEAEVGSSAELRCEWRLLGGNGLYSVKWYKDDHEFFRYIPDNSPAIQTFPQTGVFLDERLNSEKSIKLKNLTLASSGQYKCEVSTEAPSFATTYQTSNLTVIALPERGPEITGLTWHYTVGENVTANCTSWPSVPKANLRWTINGKPVPRENVVQHPALPAVSSLGIPNSLGLRLEAEPRHVEDNGGMVKIKCVAEVGSRTFEDEKRTLMSYVNNQRLSAGDFLRGRARAHRDDLAQHLLLLILVVALAT